MLTSRRCVHHYGRNIHSASTQLLVHEKLRPRSLLVGLKLPLSCSSSSNNPTRHANNAPIFIPHRNIHTNHHASSLRGPVAKDLLHFKSVLSRPEQSILTNLNLTTYEEENDSIQNELDKYNKDWTGHYHGSSNLVLRPKTTSEVASILQYCHENYISVVPQGGNTGLCGGATPLNDEIILSLEHMNAIHDIDSHSGILTCDAGCILQNLHDHANKHGHLFPLDIGSKVSLSGMVPTDCYAELVL